MSINLKNVSIGLIGAMVFQGVSQVVYNKFLKNRAAPALTAAETRSLMKSILEKLGPCQQTCEALKETVSEELQSTWGPAPPSEAEMTRVYVFPTFKAAYLKVQDRVCAEYNVHEWELEEAVEYYGRDDQELAGLAQALAEVIKSFGGGEEEDAAAGGEGGEEGGMTIASAIKAMAGRILSATNELCTKYCAMHGVPTTQEELAKFQAIYMQVGEDVQQAFFKELGTTQANWEQMIQKSISQPDVQKALQDMNTGIEAIFSKHGMKAAGGAAGGEGGDDAGSAQIVEILKQLAMRIHSSTNEYCAEFVATHGKPNGDEQTSALFMAGLEAIGESTQNEYVAELGLTPEVWKQVLLQNASSPAVQATFELITSGVSEILAQHGLNQMPQQ